MSQDTEAPLRRLRNRWRRPAAVLVLVLVAISVSGGWLMLGSGAFEVRDVEVAGTARLDPDVVARTASVGRGTPLVTLDTDAVTRRVQKLPAVRQVEVSRRWPRTVQISVVERQPAALRRDGRSFLLLDSEGVIFGSVRRRPKGLPIISVPLRLQASGRLGAPDRRALRATLSVLSALPADLRAQVLEARSTADGHVTLKLTRKRLVVWGEAEDGDRKARVLTALVTGKAKVYDISVADTPITRK